MIIGGGDMECSVHKEPAVVRLGERQSGHHSAINNTALA